MGYIEKRGEEQLLTARPHSEFGRPPRSRIEVSTYTLFHGQNAVLTQRILQGRPAEANAIVAQ